MPDKKAGKRQGNIYDRIFRENAAHIFLPLVEKILKLSMVSYKTLQVKFPQTAESEVDFLYEIINSTNAKLILHIEFQSNNDAQMLERMQEYHSKIYRKYKLPVKSLVINVGKQAFTARNKLKTEEIFTGYEIINLFELSKDELLSNQVPEVVILALLANYPKDEIETVLRLIIKKLKQIVNTEKDLKRYVNQLLLLSKLRNFEGVSAKIINNMPILFDVEKDSLYQQGVEQGIGLGIEKGVKQGINKSIILLYEAGSQPTEIAKIFKYDLAKIMQIIEAHKKKNRS